MKHFALSTMIAFQESLWDYNLIQEEQLKLLLRLAPSPNHVSVDQIPVNVRYKPRSVSRGPKE